MKDLDDLLTQAQSEIHAISDLSALSAYRVHYLGKKGKLTEYLKKLGHLSIEEKPKAGQKINSIKEAIENLIAEKKTVLEGQAIEQALALDTIDVTLSGRQYDVGTIHPISQTIMTLEKIFTQMGFEILQGPEIEDDYHNFTALNIPPLHPARAMADTFYFDDGLLLRTHVSPVQIHAMKKGKLPMRMVALGRVYRRDFDITHTPMFHQMEGLMIDENLSLADLKGNLMDFLNAFFETKLPIRFRPSYFPFVEPGAEVDIQCQQCFGDGCRICKKTGWLEILGSGMVHPNVFKAVGIDSEKYTGFAFGLGIDRLTMLKYGINDLRSLFENDLRFLKQF